MSGLGGNALDFQMPFDNDAPGFTFQDRVDFSGHQSGTVDPHVNSEVLGPNGGVVIHDLAHNQFPGFNGMQGGA